MYERLPLGERIDWIVTVINTGNASGNNIVITDTLPSELIVDSVSSHVNSTINGQTVTVTIPTLAPGESVTYTISTTVIVGEEVQNVVCLTADNFTDQLCATGFAMGELPKTGDTPLWAHLLRLLAILGGLAIVGTVVVSSRRILRGNRA